MVFPPDVTAPFRRLGGGFTICHPGTGRNAGAGRARVRSMFGMPLDKTRVSLRPGLSSRQRYIQSNIAKREQKTLDA